MNDYQERILKAILHKLLVDAGGELVLGELEIDIDAENGIVVDMDKGLLRIVALPDYISVGPDEPVPDTDDKGMPPGEFLKELQRLKEATKGFSVPGSSPYKIGTTTSPAPGWQAIQFPGTTTTSGTAGFPPMTGWSIGWDHEKPPPKPRKPRKSAVKAKLSDKSQTG